MVLDHQSNCTDQKFPLSCALKTTPAYVGASTGPVPPNSSGLGSQNLACMVPLGILDLKVLKAMLSLYLLMARSVLLFVLNVPTTADVWARPLLGVPPISSKLSTSMM